MNLFEIILENTSLQKYALVKFFMANPNKYFTRKEIQKNMLNSYYDDLLSKSDSNINPFASAKNSDVVPTILIDRLKELIDSEIIEILDSNKKEIKYRLKNYQLEEPLENYNIKEKYKSELLEWEKSFAKYSELPFADALKIVHNNSKKQFINDKGELTYFTIVDFETPFIGKLELKENITAFYNAIKDCDVIFDLEYIGSYLVNQKPIKNTLKIFHPYLLKESKGQWYLVGKCPDELDFRILPANRIIDFKNFNDESFERIDFDPIKFWEGSVGITKLGSPLTIKFKVKNGSVYNNIDYIRNVPIVQNHQEVQLLNDDWAQITLNNVFVGPELVRSLRSFGEKNIKDVFPTFLIEDLWEINDRKQINFSVRLNDELNETKFIDFLKEKLRIKPNNENEIAEVIIEPSFNKKQWHNITINNILVNSVFYFFYSDLIKIIGSENISKKINTYLK